ncbi:MAG: TraR/DksA family transcriptional regulator [Planctomycetes bacterium]|nr:TraR/DksA family transcriptional regulator [Planctomycetota bacterium]
MTKTKKKLAVKKPTKKAGSVKIKPKVKAAPEVKVRKVVREKPEVEAAPPPKPKPPTKELLEVRERLIAMLADVRNGIKNEVKGASERDLAHINDSSDIASDAAEGDLSLRIAESEGAEAEEIEKAIEKIDNGTYGSCETCNKTIGAERLRFLPFATLCIKCQELAEIRRKEDGDELDDLASGDEGGDES